MSGQITRRAVLLSADPANVILNCSLCDGYLLFPGQRLKQRRSRSTSYGRSCRRRLDNLAVVIVGADNDVAGVLWQHNLHRPVVVVVVVVVVDQRLTAAAVVVVLFPYLTDSLGQISVLELSLLR